MVSLNKITVKTLIGLVIFAQRAVSKADVYKATNRLITANNDDRRQEISPLHFKY